MSHSSIDGDRPRRPIAEPEIIPPDRGGGPSRREPEPIWTRRRIHIARPGPLGLALGLIGLGAFAAVAIVAFLGLFLILIPAVGVMIAAFVLAALLRGPRRL